MRFHRAELQRAIINHLEGTCRFHLSCRLKSFTESSQTVKLEFENGHTTTCDLLIGADGIKSVVRKGLIAGSERFHGNEASFDPMWTGSVAYRGLIPTPLLQKRIAKHRATKDPMMVCATHITCS